MIIILGIFSGFIIANETSSQVFGFRLTDIFIEKEIENNDEEGRFYCWFIDDVLETETYKNFTEFQKDLVQFQKKWCIDSPRPSPEGNLLMANN